MSVDTYKWQSDFARTYAAQGREEGREEGLAKSVLSVLAARGFEVDKSTRERILSCKDVDTLEEWVPRAVKIENPEDLFD